MGKPLYSEQLDMSVSAATHLASKPMVDNRNPNEAREGFDALFTKRTP